MVKLDIDYVENWSLMSDMILLLKTPYAVFTARGAY
jgi:lipopolysaccharide/colanic/teichoic acid biosynthesis glycosyltransferase